MEDKVPNHTDRKWFAGSLSVMLFIAQTAFSSGIQSQKARDIEKKNAYIAAINRPDKPMTKTEGGNLRDLYVAKLSELDTSLLDENVVKLFIDLMEKDENAWVPLEAVAAIVNLPIQKGTLPKVTSLLEKYRNDQRINFQVLASQSLVKIARKNGTPNLAAERTLANIAQGKDMEQWTVMIPAHNAGTMVSDPGGKAQIPFEEYSKVNFRLNAIHALAKSNSAFSKKIISGLAQDSHELVRETARGLSSGAENQKSEK
jgi:hypothetical protein